MLFRSVGRVDEDRPGGVGGRKGAREAVGELERGRDEGAEGGAGAGFWRERFSKLGKMVGEEGSARASMSAVASRSIRGLSSKRNWNAPFCEGRGVSSFCPAVSAHSPGTTTPQPGSGIRRSWRRRGVGESESRRAAVRWPRRVPSKGQLEVEEHEKKEIPPRAKPDHQAGSSGTGVTSSSSLPPSRLVTLSKISSRSVSNDKRERKRRKREHLLHQVR